MSEINFITPYCCFTGKYCTYNSGFQEGYLLGITTIFLLFSIIECTNVWVRICRGPNTVVEDDMEEMTEEDGPTDVQDTSSEDNPKADEQKKDD